MEDKNLKDYEIAFLLVSPDAGKELTDVLIQNKAEIFYQSQLAEVKLAYQIKKHASAQFGFCQFKADPESIKKTNETLILNPNVLRFMIIQPPVKLASVSSQPRQERKPAPASVMSNEMLEGKLEEMLK